MRLQSYANEFVKRAKFDWRAEWLYGYSFEYYLFAKVVMSRNVTWSEVPVTMRYPKRGVPYTKIRPVIGWYEMLRPWMVARFQSDGFAPATHEEKSLQKA